ncbi:MAG: hypothetical protein CISAcid_10480 [uncultured Acidilobus sp. CIS]|nr:MAG: hypothetical protein CISAcid_10480 [uncultured Acidilobus sp. CIS]
MQPKVKAPGPQLARRLSPTSYLSLPYVT